MSLAVYGLVALPARSTRTVTRATAPLRAVPHIRGTALTRPVVHPACGHPCASYTSCSPARVLTVNKDTHTHHARRHHGHPQVQIIIIGG
jgi:hypothetical protein